MMSSLLLDEPCIMMLCMDFSIQLVTAECQVRQYDQACQCGHTSVLRTVLWGLAVSRMNVVVTEIFLLKMLYFVGYDNSVVFS